MYNNIIGLSANSHTGIRDNINAFEVSLKVFKFITYVFLSITRSIHLPYRDIVIE